MLQDLAGALHVEDALSGLVWVDARHVAAAVSSTSARRRYPVESLRCRAAAVRTVPLGDDLVAAIAAVGVAGYLFPGDEDGHLSPRWAGKLMTGALLDH